MQEHQINNEADLDHILSETRSLSDLPLGEILVREGVLEKKQLEKVLREQRDAHGQHLGELLLAKKLISREQLNRALALKLGIPYVRLSDYEITPHVLSLIPADIALQYSVLPLAERNNRIIVAMENPLDWEALDVLRFNTNHAVEGVVTSSREISDALDKYYRLHADKDLEDMSSGLELEPLEPSQNEVSIERIEQEAQKKPVVRLVNAIIMQGILHRASDIHIRPERDRVNIYYRVDGQLQFSRSLSRTLLAPLVSRIKITARMDISERRRPQDGHSRIAHKGNSIDLRISVIPTITGESIVIRILDKHAGLKPLSALGLSEHDHHTIERLLHRSYGMILVTGPTGSGKSTTLYAMLDHLKSRQPHIITVEDPVEYDMPGVEQIQVSPGTGYTFAEALRHILRHDPDVVMVGEIRDLETAHIANRAALTGHLMLSTLHTNDAASTITRLLDMGIEPYLLGSTLLGVMAQRLVRLNCDQCMREESVEPEWRDVLGVDADEVFYRGSGCSACNNTGYHGRIAVSELLEVTPEVAMLIANQAGTAAIREVATQNGMKPLTQNALALARAGKTSLEEVFAVRLE